MMSSGAPWNDLRLDQARQSAQTCPSGDACAADVISLVDEVKRLRKQLDDLPAYPTASTINELISDICDMPQDDPDGDDAIIIDVGHLEVMLNRHILGQE